ncbi:MAG: hypothetical protein AAFX50_16310, partial [Acidobacteriota bacterium]
LRRYREAREIVGEATGGGPREDPYLELQNALTLIEQDRRSEASEIIDSMPKLGDNALLIFLKATALLGLRRFEEAGELAEHVASGPSEGAALPLQLRSRLVTAEAALSAKPFERAWAEADALGQLMESKRIASPLGRATLEVEWRLLEGRRLLEADPRRAHALFDEALRRAEALGHIPLLFHVRWIRAKANVGGGAALEQLIADAEETGFYRIHRLTVNLRRARAGESEGRT